MTPSELKDILKDHELWIESGGERGRRADLQGANLRSADLRYAYLRSAILMGVNLQSANLQGVNLASANLVGANLQGANLQHADLRGANLAGATFTTNFKKVRYFFQATFSEEQIAWVCLHPAYHEWADTLSWVKARQLSA